MRPTEAIESLTWDLQRRGYSPATVRNYTEISSRFIAFSRTSTLHGKDRQSRFVEAAQAYISRSQSGHAPAKSINLTIAALKKFFEVVYGGRLSETDLPRMKEPRELPKPIDRGGIEGIFSSEPNQKHRLLLQVTYYGGLRLSDVRFLQVHHIRSSEGLIQVQHGKGNKDRVVPLPDFLQDLLIQHTSGMAPNDYVFRPIGSQDPYPARTIQKIMYNACKREGVPGQWNIHRLRHSYATHLIQAGVNLRVVQDILGHKNPTTTMIYTKVAATDIAATRNLLVTQRSTSNQQ